MDLGEFNGRRLYTGLRLDYRLGLWTPITAVAEVLVSLCKYTGHNHIAQIQSNLNKYLLRHCSIPNRR